MMTFSSRFTHTVCAVSFLLVSILSIQPAMAESAKEYFAKAQASYAQGQQDEALSFFRKALQVNPNMTDAYYNIAAIYYNQKNHKEALDAFQQLLRIDSNDVSARYESARIYEKLNRLDEAIASYEMIPNTASRYAKAQESLQRLQGLKAAQSKIDTTPAKTVEVPSTSPTVISKATPQEAVSASSQMKLSKPTAHSEVKTEAPKGPQPEKKLLIQEFAKGFAGPTGLAVDSQGNVYVANFSQNVVYKVSSAGKKVLFASGKGINGPVGLTLDPKSGDLYIANHLDNTVAKITSAGKVSTIAWGLKKPYNIFLDAPQNTLYITQQETNSVAKIKLVTASK
jgi:hypothetical protein